MIGLGRFRSRPVVSFTTDGEPPRLPPRPNPAIISIDRRLTREEQLELAEEWRRRCKSSDGRLHLGDLVP